MASFFKPYFSYSDSNIAIETITVPVTITITVTIAVSNSYNCSQLSVQFQLQLQSVQPTKKTRLAGNKQQRERRYTAWTELLNITQRMF